MHATLESLFREQGRESYQRTRDAHLAFRHKRSVATWAQEERCIAAGQSPLADGAVIRYDHSVMPHAVEPMEAADDGGVNIIVLWMGRRMAKTEGICGNIIGRAVTDDPGNVYSMWPVQDSADRFSRDVIEPMIGATPCLEGAFVESKSRDSGRTISYKRFAGGSLYIVTAGSPSQQRGMAAKVVLMHEVDAYPESVGAEGDPVEKALGRAEGFGDAIKVIESTGTLAPFIDETGKKTYNSRIHAWYERGDMRKWFCPCRVCGALQWMKFEQIKCADGKLHRAEYVCERCEAAHIERQWRAMVRGGKWFATAGLTEEQLRDIATTFIYAEPKDSAVRSYWANGFNSLLPAGKGYTSKLHQFVAEFERVKDDPESRRVWVNEVDTSLWNPITETEPPPEWRKIFNQREDYANEERILLPTGALKVCASVDCQGNRLELEWKAWGRREESWGIEHRVLHGDIRESQVWDALNAELGRTFPHVSGAEIPLSLCFVDGGWASEYVHAYLSRLHRVSVPGVSGKVRATKGVGRHGAQILDLTWRVISGKLRGHHIGTWEAKDAIYQRLRTPLADPAPEGFMHYSRRYEEGFFQQLTAESVTITLEKGQEIRKYINPHQARNEALDLAVGNLAALKKLRIWDWDAEEKALLESIPPKPGEAPKPVAAGPSIVRAGGWR